MTLILKILLVSTLVFIAIQDIKDRYVYWFLFPIMGCFCGILFFENTLPELFYSGIFLNSIFVLLLLFSILIYSKLKLKVNLLKTIGLGDILFFLAMAVAFSTISFIVIFTSALIFSLLLHILFNRENSIKTVPLAGFMSLFLMFTYFAHWTGIINHIYNI